MPVSSEAWRAGELGTQNLCWTLSLRRRLLTLETTQSICLESLAEPDANCDYSLHSLIMDRTNTIHLTCLQVLFFAAQVSACYSMCRSKNRYIIRTRIEILTVPEPR